MTEKTKVKIPKAVIIAAIGAIAVLEGIALFKGINGTILTLSFAVIAGLAGWVSPQLKLK